MPDGKRSSLKFGLSTSLYELLEQFSTATSANLLAEGSREGNVPSLMYMNKHWRSEGQLRSTTLRSMGVTSGKILLRYSLVSMTEQEKAALDAELAREAKKQEALSEQFEKRRRENQRRDEMQQRFEKKFEERQRELQTEREKEQEQDVVMEAAASSSNVHPAEGEPSTRLDRLQAFYTEVGIT